MKITNHEKNICYFVATFIHLHIFISKQISGEIGEYIIMARKNKDRWFIAGMTNSLERTVKFDLGFLEEGKYKLTLWNDLTAVDGDYQEADISKQKVSPEDTISVKMISGGGFTGIIE